jgi:hypothetical protein
MHVDKKKAAECAVDESRVARSEAKAKNNKTPVNCVCKPGATAFVL